MTGCCSVELEQERTLLKPGPIGVGARVALALAFFTGAFLTSSLPPLALALGAVGMLLILAALAREPGCEVNLLWSRLFRRRPIDCVVFGPVDRWEQRRATSDK